MLRQLRNDLKQILGLTHTYQPQPKRPRVLGGSAIVKNPVLIDDDVLCISENEILRFSSAGVPSIKSARVIDGLFEKNTGRQVRIFLDPTAELCDEIDRFAKFTWYKLNIKQRHEAKFNLAGNIYSEDDYPKRIIENNQVIWSTIAWYFGIARVDPKYGTINVINYSDLTDDFKIESSLELSEPCFFSTIPIPVPYSNMPPSFIESEKYPLAVKEIYDFFCSVINCLPDRILHTIIAQPKQNEYVYKMRSRHDWPFDVLLNDFSTYLKINLSELSGTLKWTSTDVPFNYTTLDYQSNFNMGNLWVGKKPENNIYDPRLKFADDLVAGTFSIYETALERNGKIDNCYIESVDEFKEGMQLGHKPVSLYHKPNDDEHYQLLGTIPPEGNIILWEIETWPDRGIIDLKYDPQTGKFKPFHPNDDELIPDNLKDLSGLDLQDIYGHSYEISQTSTGFDLRNDQNSWKINYGRFELI